MKTNRKPTTSSKRGLRPTSEYQYAIYVRPTAGGDNVDGGFLTASGRLTLIPNMAVMYLTEGEATDAAEALGLVVTGEHKNADVLYFINGR